MKNTGSWNANFNDYLLIKLKNTNGEKYIQKLILYSIQEQALKKG